MQAGRRRWLGCLRGIERDAPRVACGQGRRRPDARRPRRERRYPRHRGRQWHRRARDRELRARRAPGRRPRRGAGRDGQRVRRQRLQRQRRGPRRVSGAGRDDPRRHLHRPAAAGSAGGAGEDRSQEHRRRPVPARRVAERAEEEPRRGDRLVREPGRRQPEHGVRPSAEPRLGHRAGAGARDRGAARQGRAVSVASRSSWRCRASRSRPSSRRPASCASRKARTRSTIPACTRSATRWWSGWRPAGRAGLGPARPRRRACEGGERPEGRGRRVHLRRHRQGAGKARPRSARRLRPVRLSRTTSTL